MQYNQLRPYQQRAINSVNGLVAQGKRRIVIVAPCGAGKTSISSKIISDALGAGKRCLFLAHRKELLEQCSERLAQFGVRHEVISSDDRNSHFVTGNIYVAGIQTLISREAFPPADIVIIDEAHRVPSKSYMTVVRERYGDAIILGLTATPVRTDKKSLNRLFEDMVSVADVRELIDGGYLIDPVVYAPMRVDLSEVRTKAGDYNEDDLFRVMSKSTITANIGDTWARLGKGRPTICFAVNREHGKMLCEMFRERGVKVDYLDAKTGKEERGSILAAFKSGALDMVVNVSVLTEGFDHPPTSCIILARPTKSLTVYMQACGRAMRPAPGKTDAIILDHAGCALEMGMPGDSRQFSLDDEEAKGPSPVKVCESCFAVVPASASICPYCEFEFGDTRKARSTPQEVEGELVPVVRDQAKCKGCNTSNTLRTPAKDQPFAKAYYCRTCKRAIWINNEAAVQTASDTQRRAEYERLRTIQKRKGLKPGFPNSAYRAMFGKWPPKEWQEEHTA